MSIVSTELRIGNWVDFKGYGQVNLDVFDVFFIRQCRFFQPIPLTPEILIKAGFKLLGEEENDVFYKKDIGFYFGYHISISGLIENDEFKCHGNPHIKYLHQLQNLIYTLTGEELVITL